MKCEAFSLSVRLSVVTYMCSILNQLQLEATGDGKQRPTLDIKTFMDSFICPLNVERLKPDRKGKKQLGTLDQSTKQPDIRHL